MSKRVAVASGVGGRRLSEDQRAHYADTIKVTIHEFQYCDGSTVKAVCSATFEDGLEVNDIRVHAWYKVTMPARFELTNIARACLANQVLNRYHGAHPLPKGWTW